MKKYIYSNRKEIEMKNANQNNVNELNNLNRKEPKITRIKECIDFSPESKQDSFFIKKKSNIGNYAFVEIIHKKTRTNKNLMEAKSKRNNDIIQDKIVSKNINSNNNNENEGVDNNNKIENISINNNINTKNDIKNNNKIYKKFECKINIKLNEDKKDKEKEDKNKEKEKEKEEKMEKNEEKKEKEKEDLNLSQIRLHSSFSKDKNKQKKINYEDNMPKLYTYKTNINKNNDKKERKNSSISKKEDKIIIEKKGNHNLHICDSVDKDKKYKKACKSKETNHQINESISNKKLNCSFRSINYSHSKPKKLKNILNKKSLKNHLFKYFSNESKKKFIQQIWN